MKPGSKMNQRLEAIEQRLEMFSQELQMATNSGRLTADVAALREQVELLAGFLRSLPLPSKNTFQCQHCGTVGLVATHVKCTGCGESTTWGFRPG